MTFDTGALIALERHRARSWQFFRRLVDRRLPATVPMIVIGEWWRGRNDIREQILRAVTVEPVTVELMKLAGEALASVRNATLVDAVVMASAAMRNDSVLTGDLDDLTRLRSFFPGVRLLSV